MTKRIIAGAIFVLGIAAAPTPPGWLGFTYYYRTGVSAPHYGYLLVADVATDGPAARAGLAPHDVVVEVNHKRLTYTSDAAAMAGISAVRPGQRVVLTVIRINTRRNLTLTAAPMPADEQTLWKKTLESSSKRPKSP